jgi:hypothetical protein
MVLFILADIDSYAQCIHETLKNKIDNHVKSIREKLDYLTSPDYPPENKKNVINEMIRNYFVGASSVVHVLDRSGPPQKIYDYLNNLVERAKTRRISITVFFEKSCLYEATCSRIAPNNNNEFEGVVDLSRIIQCDSNRLPNTDPNANQYPNANQKNSVSIIII